MQKLHAIVQANTPGFDRDAAMDNNIERHRAFVLTVEQGSLTRAAAQLFCSQSRVSRMIADLESEWGVTLLKRDRAGIALTAEGEALLPASRNLVNEYNAMREQVDAVRDLQTGRIRIGVISSIATHCLPDVIAEFRTHYPGIDYELLLGDYSEIEQWVREGRVDCGFDRLPCPADFDATPYLTDELMAVLPAGHPLAARERIPLQAFADEPFLALEHGTDSEVAKLFGEAGIELAPALSTWDDYAIMAMVEKGLGLSILPSLILHRVPYEIVARPLKPKAERRIGLITKKHAPHSLACERFAACLIHT